MNRYFTSFEADEKIGKRVQTLKEFYQVPEGTFAKVTGRFFVSPGNWGLDITWEHRGKHPLVDGFSKDEYERFLKEVS